MTKREKRIWDYAFATVYTQTWPTETDMAHLAHGKAETAVAAFRQIQRQKSADHLAEFQESLEAKKRTQE